MYIQYNVVFINATTRGNAVPMGWDDGPLVFWELEPCSAVRKLHSWSVAEMKSDTVLIIPSENEY